MNRNSVLRKVLSCLRIAESSTSNPHEAANALRQARALMERHGLDEGDLASGKVAFEAAPTRQRGAVLPQSLAFLAAVLAETYSCKVIQSRGARRTQVLFAGTPARARVAAYAFAVLRRLMDRDRLSHTSRVRKRDRKEARGEQFALGWVTAVAANLPRQPMGDGESRELDIAIHRKLGELQEAVPRQLSRGKTVDRDACAGFLMGSKAHVNPGLEGAPIRQLEAA